VLRRLLLLSDKAFAEAAGTFTVVFAGVGSLILQERFSGFPAWAVPVTWGAAIAAMIFTWGGVSGAHFNPVVTLIMAVSGRLQANLIPAYWSGQLAGAMTAWLLLEVLKK
jgi:glycerol uptake facilitator-like aquaporin